MVRAAYSELDAALASAAAPAAFEADRGRHSDPSDLSPLSRFFGFLYSSLGFHFTAAVVTEAFIAKASADDEVTIVTAAASSASIVSSSSLSSVRSMREASAR